MLFLAMIICVEPRKVKSSWIPLGTPIGVSASFRGCGPDLTGRGLANPSGGSGICLCMFWGLLPSLLAEWHLQVQKHPLVSWGYGGSCLLLLGLWVLSQ